MKRNSTCWAATHSSHSQAEASAAKCGLRSPGDFNLFDVVTGTRFSREIAGHQRYSCPRSRRSALGLFGFVLRQEPPIATRGLEHLFVAAKACRHEPAPLPMAVRKVGAVQSEKIVQAHRNPPRIIGFATYARRCPPYRRCSATRNEIARRHEADVASEDCDPCLVAGLDSIGDRAPDRRAERATLLPDRLAGPERLAGGT